MESEQSNNFNERLSQWVASQGFWFQLRYSMAASGSAGTAMFQVFTLGARLLVFLLVVAAGGWIYLAKRTSTDTFNQSLRQELLSGLNASEVQLGSFVRERGILGISALAGKGGEKTFFKELEARNVRAEMGFFDGVFGQWDLGTIKISKFEAELRAGADDADSAGHIAEVLFKQSDKALIHSLDVADANLRWGNPKPIAGDIGVISGTSGPAEFYSQHTRGAISHSEMKVERQGGTMRVTFTGGTFSQNWLHNLEIVKIVANCDPQGITFETAELKHGDGTVDFSGLRVTGGARPMVKGVLKIQHLDVSAVLPPSVRGVVEGPFSGDFNVSGSLNEASGIAFEGSVVLDDRDTLSLRDKIPLLKTLSVIDYSRKYRRVDFKEGSFHLKVADGGISLTRVNMTASDMMTLEGSMQVRLPTLAEATSAVTQTKFQVNPDNDEETDSDNGEDFSLEQAAAAVRRDRDARQGKGANSNLFERLDLSHQAQQLEMSVSTNLSRALQYDGVFKISLAPNAFERAPKLMSRYPVDPVTRRIPLTVPIQGTVYEVTAGQAQSIYDDGGR